MYQVKETTRTFAGKTEQGYCLVDENGIVHPQYAFDNDYARISAKCEQFNKPAEYDEELFSWWISENEKFETSTQEPSPAKEPAEAIGLDGEYKVGEVVEVEGTPYIVTQAFHISEQDASFVDEVGDVQISVGWHANAKRLVPGLRVRVVNAIDITLATVTRFDDDHIYAKLDKGGPEYSYRPGMLAPVNEQEIAALQPQIKEQQARRQVELGMRPPTVTVPPSFSIDADWLCQECGHTWNGKRGQECPCCGERTMIVSPRGKN